MPLQLDRVYDVVVIGGGINGVGVARDCAMRRLSVALFETDDLGSASSGNWAGMIHGDPKYLECEREVTRKACEDSGALQRIAPNLVFRIPMLIPVLKSDPKFYLERVEGFAKAYDRFSRIKGGKPHLRLRAEEVAAIDPGFSREISGAVSIDEWGIDPHRLIILNAKSAEQAGAQIVTRARVEKVEVQNGAVVGVTVEREGLGKVVVRARTVVNVAGAWAPFLASARTAALPVTQSKGVHLVLDRRILNIGMVATAGEGKENVFILPHEHTTVIGTTDTEHPGRPENLAITQDEVSYLIEAVRKYFPSLPEYRVMRADVGVRIKINPTPKREEVEIHDYLIHDHAKEGSDGLFTMLGGKLASYRRMAEEITDLICKRLHKRETCRTHLESLPGCTTETPWLDEARRTGIDPLTVRRLMYRHGYRASEILENARKSPELGQILCECEQVLAAEVEYCVREEWAKGITDVMRRTRLGTGPCQGCRCADATSNFMGSLLRWSNEKQNQECRRFLSERTQGTSPVLYGEQAKQQEYARLLAIAAGDSDLTGTKQ